jgi:broad specificity phosphatase PhoE
VQTTIIHAVRHAQTDFGAERRYAGSLDVDLSAKGSADALRAQDALANEHYDVVLSSPLLRARRTAELLRPGIRPEIDDRLVERNFGKLEGRTWAEVEPFDPPILLIEVGGEQHSVNPPGAEAFEDVWYRARAVANDLLGRYAGRRLLLVAHSVFLQMFTGVLTGSSCIESLALHPGNLELAEFELSDRALIGHATRSLIDETDRGF